MNTSKERGPLRRSVAALILVLAILGQAAALPVPPPREEKKKDPPPSAGLVVGSGGLVLSSQLTESDANDKVRNGCRAKVFLVRMLKGKTYTLDMVSNQIDSYLRLESPAGNRLAEDDDGGGFPNARLVFQAAEDGVHRVIGTSFSNNETGDFTLTIREQ